MDSVEEDEFNIRTPRKCLDDGSKAAACLFVLPRPDQKHRNLDQVDPRSRRARIHDCRVVIGILLDHLNRVLGLQT